MDSQTMWIVIAVLVIAAIAIAAWTYVDQRRRVKLREHFGPEYDRTLREMGSPARTDAALTERARRVEQLRIRKLTPEEQDRFERAWTRIQAMFVDDPGAALTEADRLVHEVMTTRGYPVDSFETRAADLSVDHPRVVENYRIARALAERRRRGETGTEEMRQAVVNYRALFEDLLETTDAEIRRRVS